MKIPHILSCGEVLWDLFPEGARFGGAAANFACHAALQGNNVSILSAVGHDDLGRKATAVLLKFGVDTTLVQSIPHAATGCVGVKLDDAGKPTYCIDANSAWDQIAYSTALAKRIGEIEAIYFGTLGQRSATSRSTIQQAISTAKARGIHRVLDLNLRAPFYDIPLIRHSLSMATIVKLNDEELPVVAAACDLPLNHAEPEGTLRLLRDHFDFDLVAMTRGAEGAMLVSAHETVYEPGISIQVRDTVGAGDAFTAALVSGFLRGNPLRTIAIHACKTAATVCTYAGAVPFH